MLLSESDLPLFSPHLLYEQVSAGGIPHLFVLLCLVCCCPRQSRRCADPPSPLGTAGKPGQKPGLPPIHVHSLPTPTHPLPRCHTAGARASVPHQRLQHNTRLEPVLPTLGGPHGHWSAAAAPLAQELAGGGVVRRGRRGAGPVPDRCVVACPGAAASKCIICSSLLSGLAWCL